MKKNISIIFALIFCFPIFSQNTKIITFLDNNNNPISNIIVFENNILISISDSLGRCKISNNINEINCKYFGYQDTIINVSDCSNCIIKRKTDYTLLSEITIEEKINPIDLYNNLIDFSRKQNKKFKTDTTIFYKINYCNEIIETGEKEIFSGIIKIQEKGKNINNSFLNYFICSVDNYYYNYRTNDSIYNNFSKQRGISGVFLNNSLNDNWYKKFKGNCQYISNTPDSIIAFKIGSNLDSTKSFNVYNYRVFYNKKLKIEEVIYFYEIPYPMKYNFARKKYHVKHIYSSGPLIITDFTRETSEMQIYNYTFKLSIEIEKCLPEIENNFYNILGLENMRINIERIKRQYPDLIIPSSPEAFPDFATGTP
ncbi:MAG: hypothetical protein LBV69_05935 [Bacteroidales bacterium]|jgi:hypothetical protein|nr:hypothetical protein [Bacteroidales bacterium]